MAEYHHSSQESSWEDIVHLEKQLYGKGEEIALWDEGRIIRTLNRLYAYTAYCLSCGAGVKHAYRLANTFRERVFAQHPHIQVIVDPGHLGHYTTPQLLRERTKET